MRLLHLQKQETVISYKSREATSTPQGNYTQENSLASNTYYPNKNLYKI